jgi:hypothetical protein
MSADTFNRVQGEINASLEMLRVCTDPGKRHDLLASLRRLIAEIECLSADSINRLQGNNPE